MIARRPFQALTAGLALTAALIGCGPTEETTMSPTDTPPAVDAPAGGPTAEAPKVEAPADSPKTDAAPEPPKGEAPAPAEAPK